MDIQYSVIGRGLLQQVYVYGSTLEKATKRASADVPIRSVTNESGKETIRLQFRIDQLNRRPRVLIKPCIDGMCSLSRWWPGAKVCLSGNGFYLGLCKMSI